MYFYVVDFRTPNFANIYLFLLPTLQYKVENQKPHTSNLKFKTIVNCVHLGCPSKLDIISIFSTKKNLKYNVSKELLLPFN